MGPATFKLAAMEVEAEEIKPAFIVRRPPKSRELEIVEEAVEIKPPERRARPEIFAVEEAENGPATESCAEMEEEAAEIKPLGKVCKPVKTRPEIDAPPVMDKLVAIIVPVAKSPPTVEVPLVRELPWTARVVEVAAEVVPMYNPPLVTKPPLAKVICVAEALAKEV